MNIASVQITLAELQEALTDFVFKQGGSQPLLVDVQSAYGKSLLIVPLQEGAVIEGFAFRQSSDNDC